MDTGIAALREGRFAEAERTFEALVRQQPESFEAQYYLGLTRFRLGRFEDAHVSLNKAVAVAAGRAAAWKLLGLVLAAQGDVEAALSPFQKACDLAPKEEDGCYYFGRALYSLNRFEPARAPLERALLADPIEKLWRDHLALARNFEALGMASDALPHFLEAVRKNRGFAPADEDPRIDLAVFLFRQGRAAESLQPLEDASHAFPASGRIQTEWGRVLLQLGRFKDAAARLEAAVRIDARNWHAHLLLGRVYQRLGRTEEADSQLRVGQEGLAGEDFGNGPRP